MQHCPFVKIVQLSFVLPVYHHLTIHLQPKCLLTWHRGQPNRTYPFVLEPFNRLLCKFEPFEPLAQLLITHLTHLYNASDAWKNRTLERIHRLNRQLLTPCETTSMPRAKGAAALNDGLSVDTALNTAAVGCGAAEPSMMASYLPAAVASGAPPAVPAREKL